MAACHFEGGGDTPKLFRTLSEGMETGYGTLYGVSLTPYTYDYWTRFRHAAICMCRTCACEPLQACICIVVYLDMTCRVALRRVVLCYTLLKQSTWLIVVMCNFKQPNPILLHAIHMHVYIYTTHICMCIYIYIYIYIYTHTHIRTHTHIVRTHREWGARRFAAAAVLEPGLGTPSA